MNNEMNNNGNVIGSVTNEPNNQAGFTVMMNDNPGQVMNNGANQMPNPNPGTVVMGPSPTQASPTPSPEPVNPTPVNPINPTPVNPVPAEPTPVNPTPVNVVGPNSTPVMGPEVPNNGPSAPMPNYTNPQTIPDNNMANPNPVPNNTLGDMPGFESGGVVGTTPPISLDPEKKPKKKNNFTLFIIIIVVLLIAIGAGVYFILNKTGGKAEKTSIETRNLEISIGQELPEDIKVYASIKGTAAENCSKDISQVNINKAGEYEFEIKCGGTVQKGKVTVKDDREIEVTNVVVYKVAGDTIEAKEFATSTDTTLTYEFFDQNEVNTRINIPGTHNIRLKATSTNGKTLEFDSKLIVTQYPVKRYYNCAISSDEMIEPQGTKSVSYRFVISDGLENGETVSNIYGGLAQEIYKFVINDEAKYNELKTTYATDKQVTIDGILGNHLNLTFDDANKTITIINELDNSALETIHGADKFTTYSALSQYFSGQLGYSCQVENPN